MRLYRDTNGNGTYDSGTDTLVTSTTTDSAGLYNFTLLTPSLTAVNSTKYLVVLPDTNFLTGGALVGYQNSTLTDAVNSDVDSRDHGQVSGTLGSTNGVVTTNGAVVVTLGGEPAVGVDTDGTNGNLTVDFGFYKLSLSGTVFTDNVGTANGTLDAGETTNAILTGITVRLYQDANDDDIPDGAAIATTVTTAGGGYSFTNLPAGRYIVGVVQPAAWHSTIDTASQTDANDPVSGVDNNDNGYGTSYNEVRSHSYNLVAGGATGNNAVSFASGTTSNDRLDFGMNQSPTAIEFGTVSATVNADNSVTVNWETLNETTLMGFNVQRGTKVNGDFVKLNADMIPALSLGSSNGNRYEYTDTGLDAKGTYFYRIQMTRADATTFESEAVSVKVKANNACSNKLDAPLLLSPARDVKLKAGKVEFTWQAVDCAKTYQIELRAKAPDGAVVSSKQVKDTTFSLKKLDAGTPYYWRVSSCNGKDKCFAGEWFAFQIKKDKDKK